MSQKKDLHTARIGREVFSITTQMAEQNVTHQTSGGQPHLEISIVLKPLVVLKLDSRSP